jgi:hypothetical protein
MTKDQIILSSGTRLNIKPILKDVRVLSSDEEGVQLLLATESHQLTSSEPHAATTLVVDMDLATATKLLVELQYLSAEMGWPPQEALSSQAEFPSAVHTAQRAPEKRRK